MAWSDEARAAALAARRLHAKPVSKNVYVIPRQSPSKPNWIVGYHGVGAIQYARGKAEGLRVARGQRFRNEVARELRSMRAGRGYPSKSGEGTYYYTWSGKNTKTSTGLRPQRIKVFIPNK